MLAARPAIWYFEPLSFAVMNTYLVQPKHITLSQGIEKMTVAAAQIIGVDKGHLSVGADADIAIFDLKKEWTPDEKSTFSKGKNCVFNGKKLTGKAVYTIVGGRVKYENEKIV